MLLSTGPRRPVKLESSDTKRLCALNTSPPRCRTNLRLKAYHSLIDRIGTATRSSTCMRQCESVGSDVSQFRRRQSESVDGRQAIHRRTKLQPAAWCLSQQGEKGARQACGLVTAHREYIHARYSLFNRPPGMLSQSCCRVHLQMPAWTREIPFHRRSRD